MDKFKEWLENEKLLCWDNDYKDASEFDKGKHEEISKVLNEYNKHHPTIIKLSEIVNGLRKINEDIEIKQGKNIIIEFGSKYSLLGRIVLKDNKIFIINVESFVNTNAIKWLYQLWIDETEIIIDQEYKVDNSNSCSFNEAEDYNVYCKNCKHMCEICMYGKTNKE